MRPHDIVKTREILFSELPPGQAGQALNVLTGLDDLKAERGAHENAVRVTYSVADYTLEGLESAFTAQGFHLDNSLLSRIIRALIYYCEEVQRANLAAPERQDRNREIYVQAYAHHPHGEKDDRPEEWREYR
ncbi:MAG: hypothetical protein HYU77_11530 [Betaproteobacteria bacterium]|nr:hypothetical protein [Betaproteobacteria bacterium]